MFDLKDGDDYYGWARQHPVPTADRLRLLLARRMVREGMIDQAVPYFPAEADPRFARMRYDAAGVAKLENDASRSQAAAYAAALREAGNGWGRTGRAQAWHQAGLMARRHGMEIMGYEEDPDYAVYDGSYTYGAGRNYFLWTQEHGDAIPATPAQRAEAALPGPYVTQQERERYAASEARPYARFHYRQIAASHMMKAADELPARSGLRGRAVPGHALRHQRRAGRRGENVPALCGNRRRRAVQRQLWPGMRGTRLQGRGPVPLCPGLEGLGTAAPRPSAACWPPAGAGGRRRGCCAVGLARARAQG